MRWHVIPKHKQFYFKAKISILDVLRRPTFVLDMVAPVSTFMVNEMFFSERGTYWLFRIAIVDIVFDKAMVHGDVVTPGR